MGYSPWGPKELYMIEHKCLSLRTSSPKESVFSQVIVVIAVQLLSHVQLSATPWALPPLFLLPSILASIKVFSNEYSGLISFRIDWFDFLAVQGTLKSLLQHHSSKALVLQNLGLLYSPTFIPVQDY